MNTEPGLGAQRIGERAVQVRGHVIQLQDVRARRRGAHNWKGHLATRSLQEDLQP